MLFEKSSEKHTVSGSTSPYKYPALTDKILVKITGKERVSVPWLLLAKSTTEYLDADCIPESFRVTDPSKLTKAGIFNLWAHWRERERKGLPILRFVKAKRDDMALTVATSSVQSRPKKRPYVIVNSEDEEDSDKSDNEPPTVASRPPSKKARVLESEELEGPQAGSPAAQEARTEFLQSLSTDPVYHQLCDKLSSLPLFVSSSLVLPTHINSVLPKGSLVCPGQPAPMGILDLVV
jgi:hypothetical protein